MSRVEKFGKRGRGQQLNANTGRTTSDRAESGNDSVLPPRSDKHPSSSQKISKWYYNLLFFLFVCLVAGLFWYGLKYTN